MMELLPHEVMSSGLLSYPGGWARLRLVKLAISLMILVGSSTMFLVSIDNGML